MKLFAPLLKTLSCATLALGISLVVLGCNGDSAEGIVRQLEIIVQGFYGPVGGNTTIVSGNTGNPVTSLNLRQNGDQLEGNDNNNIIFKGTVGQATEDTASFNMNGFTTAGEPVTISGTISVPVGSSSASMNATWIEPSLFANLAAEATVPVNNPDTGSSTNGTTNTVSSLTVTANPSTIFTDSADLTSTISVSGSDGTLNVSRSDPDLGEITGTSGNSATYQAIFGTVGSQTITVTDGSGASGSTTITQN